MIKPITPARWERSDSADAGVEIEINGKTWTMRKESGENPFLSSIVFFGTMGVSCSERKNECEKTE